MSQGTDQVIFWKFWLEGVLLSVVGTFGVGGNLVTLLILATAELDLSNSFSQMLTALLLSDTICIIMAFMLFSLPHLTNVSPYLVPIALPIAQVALTVSVYMIIVLSLERFLVVTRPQKQLPHWTGWVTALVVLGMSIFSNITRFFEYRVFVLPKYTLSMDNLTVIPTNISTLSTLPTQLRTDKVYSKVSSLLSLLFMHLFPLLFLSLVNIAIFNTVRKSSLRLSLNCRQKRDLTVATALTMIVLVFIISNIFKFAINLIEFYEVVKEVDTNIWGNFMNIAVAISHFLVVFNCSTNSIIYCSKDSKFRNIILKFLSKMFNFNKITPGRTSSQSSLPMLAVSKTYRTIRRDRNSSLETSTL